MSGDWVAGIVRTLSPGDVTIAVLLLATALWEHGRPEHAVDEAAGQRWLANFSLFAINESARLWLAPLIAAATGPWPVHLPLPAAPGLRYLILLPALDLTVYLLHRLFHQVPWLWRVHAIHHTDIAVDVSTAVRHHPFEATSIVFALVAIGGLLGATPGEIAVYTTLAFAVQLVAHANVGVPRFVAAGLAAVVVTPQFHRLHHACDVALSNANYGEILVVWDRLFGTAVAPPAAEVPASFGVAVYLAPRFRSLGWILLQPFLARPAVTAPLR
jgi:sterol desaturase/sphingolipid hydroxylase (fatty acid hydroxylase superfamily)